MVSAWRATVKVPAYGTEAAAAFSCPWVGGAPGAGGPDTKAVAALSAMLKGGNRNVSELVKLYQNTVPNADPAEVVNALIAAYCPVVAAGDLAPYEKYAELNRLSMQAAADVSPEAAAVSFPPVDVIWAAPAGRSLVAELPDPSAGKLTCPAIDGKLVPRDLTTQAQALIGAPKTPVPGSESAELATTLATKNPQAAPADVANALIASYCSAITAAAPLARPEQAAQAFGFVQGFGQQVIETLQLRASTPRRSAG